jgi:hypothetical protein
MVRFFWQEMRDSMRDSEVILEGYLAKQSTGIKKAWQTRYFELSGHYLKYYTSAAKGEVKAVADMNELQMVESDSAEMKELSEFILVSTN